MPKASQKMKATRVRQGVASLSVLVFSNQIAGVVSTQAFLSNNAGTQAQAPVTVNREEAIQKSQNPEAVKKSHLRGPGPVPVGLRVRSFNLEGRGGNKGNQEGQSRAEKLKMHLNALHKQPNAPDVILTQEDIDEDIEGYEVRAECMGEEYWCEQGSKYGDGCDDKKEKKDRRMRNRVYVKTNSQQPSLGDVSKFEDKSQTFIVETHEEARSKSPVSAVMTTKLTGDNLQKLKLDKTENEIKAGSSNPRCAAIAVNTETGAAFVSFHLSGGYSDDMAARHWMKKHKYAPTLKQDELQLLAGYLSDGNNGISYAIAGGDTNGLTGEQAKPSTEAYFEVEKNARRNTFDGVTPESWTAYQTIPESFPVVGADFRSHFVRLHVSNNDNSANADLLSSSSSIYGGVVDHFYMFQNQKSPQIPMAMPTVSILPEGLSVDSENGGRLQRELSDHNPMEVVLPIEIPVHRAEPITYPNVAALLELPALLESVVETIRFWGY